MTRRLVIVFWVLVLGPALILGAGAVFLLQREQARLRDTVRETWTSRADALAAALDLAVTDAEAGMLKTMADFPENDLRPHLDLWRRESPLIRNVFLWAPKAGLLYPNAHQPATPDEADFLRRCGGLFANPARWQGAGTPTPASGPAASASSLPGNQQLTQQMQLRKLSVAPRSAAEPATDHERGHWITWFADNQLALVGWVRQPDTGAVRGVELEMMALLARLTPLFPARVPAGVAYALEDGNGTILHQAGALALDRASGAFVRVPCGPALPHWEISVYLAADPTRDTRRALGGLGVLLAGIFVSSILAGGLLLAREARRNRLDALRKTTFVANVSHELKTPLTSIRMYAELLSGERPVPEAKRRHYLDVIVTESQRLTRLINNVLDFSRIEQGRKRYACAPLDLVRTISDLLANHGLALQQAGLRLECQFPDNGAPVMVVADRDVVEQAAINLLDNAIKYAADGRELAVALTPAPEQVRLAFMDRGPGIPPADRERVFEMFYRGDATLTERKPGCGLGLTISRKVLRDTGCDLRCEARTGGGAVFVMLLPLATAAEEAKSHQ